MIPAPIPLPAGFEGAPALLALGAELKNTFCLTRDRYAFLSQHIGDMENYETMQAFEDGVRHLERLFQGAGHTGFRLWDAQLTHFLAKAVTILCQVNGVR